MPRKPKKGYFVRGEFVAAGSDLDLQLQREHRGEGPSKTDLKRMSSELQLLGEQLIGLRADLQAELALPDKLIDALAAARTITDFEGRRRQLQFIGKLMRRLDEETLRAVRAALDAQRMPSAEATAELHRAERWRDRLLTDDAALGDWVALHPDTDVQGLRALLRQARRDAAPEPHPGAGVRHSRSYREVFHLVKDQLGGARQHDSTAATQESQDSSHHDQ